MQFTITAAKRVEQGTGASRRLRRTGKIPGIIYGGTTEPAQVMLDHNELFHMLRNERFHSSVLSLNLDGAKESVVLRNTQWHPFRQQVLHLDFLRVDAAHKIHMKIPLHFLNADQAPGVKLEGGIISHVLNELEVTCLPANLPEFIEVDLKDLKAGESIHVSQLKLPEGVEVTHSEGDPVVAALTIPRGALADTTEDAAAATAAAATPEAKPASGSETK